MKLFGLVIEAISYAVQTYALHSGDTAVLLYQADVKEHETKKFKFPAVFPMVFYIGSGKWTVPMSLKEMFDGYESFGNYLINFSYALVDVKGYDDEGVKAFRSRLLKVMMILEQAKHFEGIQKPPYQRRREESSQKGSRGKKNKRYKPTYLDYR